MAPHRKSGPVLSENILFFCLVMKDLVFIFKRFNDKIMTALNRPLKRFHNNHYVYNLHQKNGFTCMLLGEIFELVYVSCRLYFVLVILPLRLIC